MTDCKSSSHFNQTLIDLLRARAAKQADSPAFTWLRDGDVEEATWTYADLERRARAVAVELHRQGVNPGDRALLIYPPGLDFIAGFFGCLAAGVIAAPCYPPGSPAFARRAAAVRNDCGAKVGLTTAAVASPGESAHQTGDLTYLAEMQLIATDQVDLDSSDQWNPPATTPDSVAFLQYTSGSTSEPRGVMDSHRNIISNVEMLKEAWGSSEASTVVGWLPLFHDMGLIAQVLHAVYLGAHCVLMSPECFVAKPGRWLRAISKYRGVIAGGPNFGYELCARKISADERRDLDLKSWKVAFNGAEPVRPDTLDRFANVFEPCGFDRGSLYPCYGLAEATLFVTGGPRRNNANLRKTSKSSLGLHLALPPTDEMDATTLVGCGQTWGGLSLRIVKPETHRECQPNEIGEIWVSGPSVAMGYWQNAAATAETFEAMLDGVQHLRTGDLGFMADGNLFVTGRLKDLIIIRGRNIYPQDVERVAEKSHPSLRPGCGAAFPMASKDGDSLAIVQEVREDLDVSQRPLAAQSIRNAILSSFGVVCEEVVLLPANQIPKTSSGKIQRRLCRQLLLDQQLSTIFRLDPSHACDWNLSADSADSRRYDPRFRRLLSRVFARAFEDQCPSGSPFDRSLLTVGYDSLEMALALSDIETITGLTLPASTLADHPTINRLTAHLSSIEQSAAGPNASFQIVPARTDWDLADAGRLRYDVTVRELGLPMSHADHEQSIVVEPLDHHGVVLLAREHERVIGTIRINLLRDADIGMYYDAYALNHFGDVRNPELSIATRLAIAPRQRNSRLFLDLMLDSYRYLLRERIRYNVIDCRPHLVSNYLSLGYKIHKPEFSHPEFGKVVVLAIDLFDVEALRRNNSPLVAVARDYRPISWAANQDCQEYR